MIDYNAYHLSKEDFHSRINLIKRGKYSLFIDEEETLKFSTSIDAAEKVIGLGRDFSGWEATR